MSVLKKSAIEVLRPPEKLSVTEWAEKHIYIPKEVSPYAGYFRAGFNQYLNEPLNQFGNKSTNRLTICFASDWENYAHAYWATLCSNKNAQASFIPYAL